MANTFDAALLVDTLADKAKTTLGNRLAPLSAFSRDYSTNFYRQGKAHIVTVVTGGNTTAKNPTSFESAASTKVPVSVTIDHYSQRFGLTTLELNEKHKLEDAAEKELQVLADSLLDVAFAPITAANFTNGSGVLAEADIDADDLKTGWAAVSKSPQRNCILDSVAYSRFLPSDKNSFVPGQGAYGFDGFYLNTRWSGAEAGVYGFICGPDAIVQASGIPDIHPAVKQLLFESKIVTLDQLGLSVQINMWGSASSRGVWASYDLFFGAAFGADANAGYRIKSA